MRKICDWTHHGWVVGAQNFYYSPPQIGGSGIKQTGFECDCLMMKKNSNPQKNGAILQNCKRNCPSDFQSHCERFALCIDQP